MMTVKIPYDARYPVLSGLLDGLILLGIVVLFLALGTIG